MGVFLLFIFFVCRIEDESNLGSSEHTVCTHHNNYMHAASEGGWGLYRYIIDLPPPPSLLSENVINETENNLGILIEFNWSYN